jgi:1-acyl-sn-glycerol-3-phosphate acyltransferase
VPEPYEMSKLIGGPFMRLLWHPKVTGIENVPASGGAIIASNHLSIVDSLFLPLIVPRPVTFAAKSEYFTGRGVVNRITSAYLRATKQLSVDRTGARAGQAMLEAALGLVQQGGLFAIYPEGTRSPDGRLYRGRVGVGWLALHSGLPVIPVGMSGTDRVLPPGRTVPRITSVRIRIGEPLTFKADEGQPCGAPQRRAVTDEVMKSIQALTGQEYVPIYASVRKEQMAANGSGAA